MADENAAKSPGYDDFRSLIVKSQGSTKGNVFKVLYSTLHLLPPLRIHCVGGCWDRTQDCCDFELDSPDAVTNWLDLISC
jgi:hypothetical protein